MRPKAYSGRIAWASTIALFLFAYGASAQTAGPQSSDSSGAQQTSQPASGAQQPATGSQSLPPQSSPAPSAQTPPNVRPSSTATGTLHGTVTDPTGATVPGASITLTPASGQPITATTNSTGGYDLRGVPVGRYDLKASASGFQVFDNPNVAIASDQVRTLDVSLAILVEKEQVQVNENAATLDVNPENNVGAIVLKGADLDALSDDPDELQQDLQALAGPTIGPNGGQMYIDGFTAGELPPKSSIREIRINQNPFSSEYDQMGFGRIEILTKPGTDKLHGSFSVMGNDQPFNSWSPFVLPGQRPGYYTLQYEGNISGAINKRASYFVTFQRRDINQLELGATQDASFNVTSGAVGVPNPRVRTTISPRLDYQLSKNNTLTVRYQYWDNNEKNDGITAYSVVTPNLANSPAYNSHGIEHQLQATDSQIFHNTIVNETRFQYLHNETTQTPFSTSASFSAPGYVTAGGNSIGYTSDDQNRFEFQNYTTIAYGKQAIKFGVRARDETDANYALTNGNGSFVFAGSAAYQAARLAVAAGQPVPAPDQPISFTLGVGSPNIWINAFDVGFFIQDDWRWKPNVTLSGGLRFESQTGIPDHGDYAPRLAAAWGIGKTKTGSPSVVLRAGWGIFYTRFGATQLENVARYNGINQIDYTVRTTSFFPFVPASQAQLSSVSPNQLQPTLDTISPGLHAPYTMETAATLEKQLTRYLTISLNYINARGVHQFYTANINTPEPGTFSSLSPQTANYPYGYDGGYINQYFSGGIFKQNELITNFNLRVNTQVTLNGFYALNYANGTTSGLLSDYYDPSLDYGRASFDVRNRLFFGGTVNMPYGVHLNPFLIYNSGTPYNITSGTDLYGTSPTAQNARPSFTTLPANGTTVFSTPWGNLYNGVPQSGESIIPLNLGTGPSQFSTNLSISRTFTFGGKSERASAPRGGGGGFGGPGGGGGGPRGGGGRGGAVGFASAPRFGGGPASTPGRYSLTFTVMGRNIFNRVNLGTPVGAITSPNFLRSVGLAGGFFNGSAYNREINLQARFSF